MVAVTVLMVGLHRQFVKREQTGEMNHHHGSSLGVKRVVVYLMAAMVALGLAGRLLFWS